MTRIALLLLVFLADVLPAVPTIDLSGWDWQRTGPRTLEGDWAFFDDQLLSPDEVTERLAAADREVATAAIPRSWETGFGHATYVVRLILPPDEVDLSLRIDPASTAYQLFADGKPVASSGRPGVDADSAVPGRIVRTPRLPRRVDPSGLTAGEVHLVLHVSNYQHRRGGMWQPIRIGATPDILAHDLVDLAYDLVLLGVAVAFGLYNVVIFAAGSRRSPAPLFLAGFFLAFAVRVPTLGSILVTRILPEADWNVIIGLEYLTGHAIIACFALVLQHTWPRLVGVRYAWIVGAGMAFFTVWLFVGGVTAYSMAIHAFVVVAAAALMYPLGLMVRALWGGRRDILPGILATAVVLAIVVSEWAHFTGWAPSRDGLPLGLLMGLVAPKGLPLTRHLLLNGTALVVVLGAGSVLLHHISRGIFAAAVRESVRPALQPERESVSVAELTPRENEISRLVAEGLSNKEIAALLFVSDATVRTHIYRIFRKLGVGNRTELALLFRRSE